MKFVIALAVLVVLLTGCGVKVDKPKDDRLNVTIYDQNGEACDSVSISLEEGVSC